MLTIWPLSDQNKTRLKSRLVLVSTPTKFVKVRLSGVKYPSGKSFSFFSLPEFLWSLIFPSFDTNLFSKLLKIKVLNHHTWCVLPSIITNTPLAPCICFIFERFIFLPLIRPVCFPAVLTPGSRREDLTPAEMKYNWEPRELIGYDDKHTLWGSKNNVYFIRRRSVCGMQKCW